MVYEELLMDSSTLLKFKLFKKIMFLGSAVYPIAQIASDMDLNYQQTVIDLSDIDKLMKTINPNHQSILAGAGKINCQNISCTIDEFRYQLLQSSVPFQFIMYFLNEEQPTIEDFCERFYSSRSTVSRKIEKLKQYLKQYNLRFTYTEAGLVGDERVARLALFDLVWLGVRGIKWPFTIEEALAEEIVAAFAKYFPLSKTYVGRHELKFFAAIFYQRIQKGYFVKYDKSYDFLMKDNAYYDFTRLESLLDLPLTSRQLKAETSFVYFLAHFVPFYTMDEDPTMLQTVQDFSQRQNPVYSLAKEYLAFAKEEFFSEGPEILDQPMFLANLINIAFGYYILRRPFPTLQQLVEGQKESVRSITQIEEKTLAWMEVMAKRNEFAGFITRQTAEPLANSFTQVLIPYFDWTSKADKVIVGVALEHNYLLVKNLYSYLSDLRFVLAEPFDSNKAEGYDLTISSSLLLKKRFPKQNIFLWDHAGDDNQMVALYKRLRKLFNEKNR